MLKIVFFLSNQNSICKNKFVYEKPIDALLALKRRPLGLQKMPF